MSDSLSTAQVQLVSWRTNGRRHDADGLRDVGLHGQSDTYCKSHQAKYHRHPRYLDGRQIGPLARSCATIRVGC